MKLNSYSTGNYSPGASLIAQVAWYLCSNILFSNRLIPGSAWRCFLLRTFGAKIGPGVVIKPGVRIKFPWRLKIGDHSWIGEAVWIDNVACVSIGSNTCLSQAAYLCGGSHDFSKESFDLLLRPIEIGDQVWIAANVSVSPGAKISDGAVVTLGSVASGELDGWSIYSGNPASKVKDRPRPSSL